MDTIHLTLYALWAVLLLNLVLTLRILRWVRTVVGHRGTAPDERAEVRIGTPAPTFRAETLTGERVSERTYADRALVLVFVSPDCGGCRVLLPMVDTVGAAARRAGTSVVLVVDVGRDRARGWLEAIEHEDGRTVTLPVLLAPPSRNPMVPAYNGAGFFPYFCLVDGDGTVAARGIVGMDRPEWQAVVERWIPRPASPGTRPLAVAGDPGPL
jgi:hypothetical protein